MTDLTQEQFEELPDFLKGDYTEVEGVYKHAGMLKVKQTANDLDGKLKAAAERLAAVDADKAAAVEAARKQALADARKNSDVEALEKLHKDQLADAVRRATEDARLATLDEVKQERAREKALGLAAAVAADVAVDADARETLRELLERRVTIDPATGKEVYLGKDGSATSLDRAGFIAEIHKDGSYKRLLKATVPASGGGLANGSNGNGSASPAAANMAGTRAEREAAIRAKYPNLA